MSKAVTMADARKHMAKVKFERDAKAVKRKATKKASKEVDPLEAARKSFLQYTVADLISYAENNEIDLGEVTKKADIVEIIMADKKDSE